MIACVNNCVYICVYINICSSWLRTTFFIFVIVASASLLSATCLGALPGDFLLEVQLLKKKANQKTVFLLLCLLRAGMLSRD